MIIAAELVKAGQSIEKQHRDPFTIKASIILAISTGLLVNGFLQMWRIGGTGTPITVDKMGIFNYSVLFALGIITLLVVAAIYFLGRSSRSHLVLVEVVFAGSLGAFLTSVAEFRDINIEFDKHETIYHVVDVHDKSMSGGRGATFRLYFDDWSGADKNMNIKVPVDFYNAVDVGDRLKIGEKPGYLGWRWIESVEKVIKY